MTKTDLIVILGATATGKTQLATHLALKLNGEVISADSRQVYRGMDIGTGKDLADYHINGTLIPFHLIDIKDAGEEYNLYAFQEDFLKAYVDIKNRQKQPVLCGGTGMYIESAVKGYRLIKTPIDEQLRTNLSQKTDVELVELLMEHKTIHNTTDSVHRDRIIRAIEIAIYESEHQELKNDYPTIKSQLIGIRMDRETIKKRIRERLRSRLENEGMIEEVESLLASGITADQLKFYGLEYKFVTQFLLKEINRQELFEQLTTAIHQFSKRQATWFRRMERNGFEINWIDGNLSLEDKVSEVCGVVDRSVNSKQGIGNSRQ